MQILAQSSEPDVITDVSWGPNDESTFCTSNGNGKITSWLNCRNVGSFQAHVQEVSSIDWLEHILTSSWDGSVKIVSHTQAFSRFQYSRRTSFLVGSHYFHERSEMQHQPVYGIRVKVFKDSSKPHCDRKLAEKT